MTFINAYRFIILINIVIFANCTWNDSFNVLSQSHYYQDYTKSKLNNKQHYVKRNKSPIRYYDNSVATFNVIIECGDIEQNPGPSKTPSPRCPICAKAAGANRKRLICPTCKTVTHASCSELPLSQQTKIKACAPLTQTCSNCLISELPFHNTKYLDISNSFSDSDSFYDSSKQGFLNIMQKYPNHLNIIHLNTQSLPSSFNEFSLMVEQYKFDIITLSETWLKDNQLLLDYVSIPGYDLLYNNRDKTKGGGVGCYIKSEIKYKRRKDLESLHPELEHLWLEIPGRNKHSRLLLGTVYRSNLMLPFSEWISKFQNIVSVIKCTWHHPFVITGDMNINTIDVTNSETKIYLDTLTEFGLEQVITKPTRVTKSCSSLIDHIIVSDNSILSHQDVLPCGSISDHDGVYVILNVRKPRYHPRYKYIRDEKSFNQDQFISEAVDLPFHLVYAFDDPDDQLDTFNKILLDHIEHHAPMKRIKVTRPPAPWMQNGQIRNLQSITNELRHQAHLTGDDETWKSFRQHRNMLKQNIRKAKKMFYQRILNQNKPKEIWKVVNGVLNPTPKPFNLSLDVINKHFAQTAERTLKTEARPFHEIHSYINELQTTINGNEFSLRPVTYGEIKRELQKLRNDVSTGSDGIPTRYIKLIVDAICSPLTHVINSYISENRYPPIWKLSRVVPIPKVKNPADICEYRPISIQTALSKIFEKLVLNQMLEFIESNHLYKDTMTGFRKGYNTNIALMKFRDDILKSMSCGEVTLAVLIDFSKAFDTISHETFVKKLHTFGFSNDFIKWVFSYLTQRRQYVQTDDKRSNICQTNYGVPQGSILGPVFFNLYASDLQDSIDGINSIQYADDTTVYISCKPHNLQETITKVSTELNNLRTWSTENSLTANAGKTKAMLFSSKRMENCHDLNNVECHVTFGDRTLDKVSHTKLLGITFDQHLQWNDHIKKTISSVYGKLAVIRKLKHFVDFKTRKMIAQSLLLSHIDFGDMIYAPLTKQNEAKLHRLQLAIASFVIGKYASIHDILKLNWLPVRERRCFNYLKCTHKAIHDPTWPNINKLEVRTHQRSLRNNNTIEIKHSNIKGTFQQQSSHIFNSLPQSIRNTVSFNEFCNKSRRYLMDSATARSLSAI